MAVVHRSTVAKTLEDFDRYCKALRDEIQGKEVPPDEARRLLGPDRFDVLSDPALVSISPDRIEDAIEHLKATFLALKRLKTKGIR